MDEPFVLKVNYKGEEHAFEGRLLTAGYIHRFQVSINYMEVIYEPDEERNYRAILHADVKQPISETNLALINLVGEWIENITD